MLPENKISSEAVASSFLTPDRNPTNLLIDYELGGVDIRDTSQGLNKYLWQCNYEDGWVVLDNTVKKINWLQVPNISELSLSFDFNMNPLIAYVAGDRTYLNWFDSSAQGFVTTPYGSEVTSPQISLDDNRTDFSQSSDVIFAYVKDYKVWYRQQRDRYEIEYFVGEVPDGLTLVQVGMNKKYRFQFKVY